MKEFKVNDFLTVKLEEEKINIYVNGKFFEQYQETETVFIEEQFQFICSDFKKWYEREYKDQIGLNTTLFFRLLSELAGSGDPIAAKTFSLKEKIRKCILSGDLPSILSIMLDAPLSIFSIGELNEILKSFTDIDLKAYQNKDIRKLLHLHYKNFVYALDSIENRHVWTIYYTCAYEDPILDNLQSMHLNFILRIVLNYLDDRTILKYLNDLAKTNIFHRMYKHRHISDQETSRYDAGEDWVHWYDNLVFPTLINDKNLSKMVDLVIRCFEVTDDPEVTELFSLYDDFIFYYCRIIYEPLTSKCDDEEIISYVCSFIDEFTD